jgi:hypothetical protein
LYECPDKQFFEEKLTMTDTNIKVREHYSTVGFTDRLKAALATVTPESEALTRCAAAQSIRLRA